MPITNQQRDIPSLDGFRALSIVIVILAHSAWYFPHVVQDNLLFRMIVGNGAHGVACFFVISGYLITTLLMREFNKTGGISFKRFYFRRTMRIFPPFYVLLAVMGILWAADLIPEHPPSFVAAATYTWSLYPDSHGYYLTHSWSLSIEELFYLIWPVVFLWGYRKQKIVKVAIFLIVVMPVIRVLLYFAAPPLRGHEGYMVQGWADTMMVGCLLALLKNQASWDKWHNRYVNGWTAGAMAIIGFVLVPWIQSVLPRRPAGFFNLSCSFSLTALCIGGILLYLVEHPESPAARFLDNRVIRHIGVLSYSLYLWQQLLTSHQIPLLPYGYLYAIIAAELSFWFVEQPSLALRARLLRNDPVSHSQEPGRVVHASGVISSA